MMWPNRWLPILRRMVRRGGTTEARAAARALSDFGTFEDVPLVVAWERTYVRQASERTLWTRLARRTSPTLSIHDLGRSSYSVGARAVHLKQTRRKAAALLMYLVSRPKQTATREQVLDELWPEQTPRGAANSLHQTLYFLRRTIDPWYEDDLAIDYIVFGSEVVFLEPDLVHIDSISFQRQAADAITRGNLTREGPAILQSYGGRFAPEFAYEEWAMSWSDRVHSTYLQLAQATSNALIDSGQPLQAVNVLSAAAIADPEALEIEAALVRALWLSGARAAAAEQYGHFALAHQRDLGLAAPALSELVTHPSG